MGLVLNMMIFLCYDKYVVSFSFESVPYFCSLMFHCLKGLVCRIVGIIVTVIAAEAPTVVTGV